MPYAIRKSGKKFAVVKKDGSKTFGTHLSREKAKKQLAALHIHADGVDHEIEEMPHLELDKPIGDIDGFVDLSFEKYANMSKSEKEKLLTKFNESGAVVDVEGEWFYMSPEGKVSYATDENMRDAARLPEDWNEYVKTECFIPTMRDLFKTNS